MCFMPRILNFSQLSIIQCFYMLSKWPINRITKMLTAQMPQNSNNNNKKNSSNCSSLLVDWAGAFCYCETVYADFIRLVFPLQLYLECFWAVCLNIKAKVDDKASRFSILLNSSFMRRIVLRNDSIDLNRRRQALTC